MQTQSGATEDPTSLSANAANSTLLSFDAFGKPKRTNEELRKLKEQLLLYRALDAQENRSQDRRFWRRPQTFSMSHSEREPKLTAESQVKAVMAGTLGPTDANFNNNNKAGGGGGSGQNSEHLNASGDFSSSQNNPQQQQNQQQQFIDISGPRGILKAISAATASPVPTIAAMKQHNQQQKNVPGSSGSESQQQQQTSEEKEKGGFDFSELEIRKVRKRFQEMVRRQQQEENAAVSKMTAANLETMKPAERRQFYREQHEREEEAKNHQQEEDKEIDKAQLDRLLLGEKGRNNKSKRQSAVATALSLKGGRQSRQRMQQIQLQQAQAAEAALSARLTHPSAREMSNKRFVVTSEAANITSSSGSARRSTSSRPHTAPQHHHHHYEEQGEEEEENIIDEQQQAEESYEDYLDSIRRKKKKLEEEKRIAAEKELGAGFTSRCRIHAFNAYRSNGITGTPRNNNKKDSSVSSRNYGLSHHATLYAECVSDMYHTAATSEKEIHQREQEMMSDEENADVLSGGSRSVFSSPASRSHNVGVGVAPKPPIHSPASSQHRRPSSGSVSSQQHQQEQQPTFKLDESGAGTPREKKIHHHHHVADEIDKSETSQQHHQQQQQQQHSHVDDPHIETCDPFQFLADGATNIHRGATNSTSTVKKEYTQTIQEKLLSLAAMRAGVSLNAACAPHQVLGVRPPSSEAQSAHNRDSIQQKQQQENSQNRNSSSQSAPSTAARASSNNNNAGMDLGETEPPSTSTNVNNINNNTTRPNSSRRPNTARTVVNIGNLHAPNYNSVVNNKKASSSSKNINNNNLAASSSNNNTLDTMAFSGTFSSATQLNQSGASSTNNNNVPRPPSSARQISSSTTTSTKTYRKSKWCNEAPLQTGIAGPTEKHIRSPRIYAPTNERQGRSLCDNVHLSSRTPSSASYRPQAQQFAIPSWAKVSSLRGCANAGIAAPVSSW